MSPASRSVEPSTYDRSSWAAHGFHGEAADLLAEGSLVRAWTARWREAPDRPVLHDPTEGWLTGAQLAQRTESVARRLAALGVQGGDRVILSAEPSIHLVLTHVGALRLGAVVVPVNTAFAPNEIANVARESAAVLAVLDDPERLPDADTVTPAALCAPDATAFPERTHDLELDTAGPDDTALLVFTSGTTGKPKGARLTHGNLLSSVQALIVAWRWTRDDRLVLALPLFHMHGLGVGVHGTLTVGASAVIVPKFSADAVLDAARDHRATLFFGVPTMWVRLLESPRLDELRSLRLCVSGSAALAPDVFDALVARAGQRIVERYGMTETVMNVSNPFDGDRRPGAVGLPLPGVSLRLAGADSSADATGEILLKGPNVFPGYWERPDADAEAFDADGWFRTGDLGRLDPDGYVRIVGRSKDLIITGGYNVYPRDIEEVLRLHPAVADVAVVGEPSAEWGETVTACVVAAPGVVADPDELATYAAAHLAGYQKPRRVVLVDDLPRNALGKVVKAQLVQQISAL